MTATLPGELIYRVILDYEALHEMFRDRVEDLNTSRISIDEAGKFTPGYSAKLLSNPPMRMLSRESLGKMLDATGMVLVAVVDDARFAVVKGTLAVRKRRDKLSAVSSKRIRGQITIKSAHKMLTLRNQVLSEARRKSIAKKAGKASGRIRRKRMRERLRERRKLKIISEMKPAAPPDRSPRDAPAKRLFRAPTPQPSGATGQNDLRSPQP